ncbi:MAG: hypothetical protein V2I32_09360 [Desulforhopalus sp.]|jgi:predicted metallo-beta-lactamase superfamily hydrolase|nr:hypothetical protein [Desulforhopalus sp.]
MEITILGTESLGVRGLCCMVRSGERQIVIDPGLALGLVRYGRYPHPLQVAVAEKVRRQIITAVAGATELVISHFHGDHIPLSRPNPYQLGIDRLPPGAGRLPVWRIGDDGLSDKGRKRCADLQDYFGGNLQRGEGTGDDRLAFSEAVPHGEPDGPMGKVMMTRVGEPGSVFVHASDIQLFHHPTISRILAWEPDIVLASGPPLYLEKIDQPTRHAAWENALQLARAVKTLIIDHHLLRDHGGLPWLTQLSAAAGREVFCAARFMARRPLLLEARREELYAAMPVAEEWHQRYARGEAGTAEYLQRAALCGLSEVVEAIVDEEVLE